MAFNVGTMVNFRRHGDPETAAVRAVVDELHVQVAGHAAASGVEARRVPLLGPVGYVAILDAEKLRVSFAVRLPGSTGAVAYVCISGVTRTCFRR